jgi:hypothetical protein
LSKISEINIIREFKNGKNTYGIYSVAFNEKQEIFIKNEDSVGAVQHYWGEPASKCISEIRDDVKQEFLSKLEEIKKI